jgi:hypothetical protein
MIANDSKRNESEVAKRRDDALRRALMTPPKPKQNDGDTSEQKPKKAPSTKRSG